MKKIQVLGMKADLKKVLALLQKSAVMQIEEIHEDKENETPLEILQGEDHDVDLLIAQTEFAIRFLSPYAKKRPIWAGKPSLTMESAMGTVKGFDYRETIRSCQKLEEKHVATLNEIHALETETALLEKWADLPFDLNTPRETNHTQIYTGEVPEMEYDTLENALKKISELTAIEKINKIDSTIHVIVVLGKEHLEAGKQLLMAHKFQETELPTHAMSVKERLKSIAKRQSELQAMLQEDEIEFKKLAIRSENLQIIHDVFVWQQEEERVREKLKGTTYSFVITGWIAKLDLKKIEKELEENIPHTAIHTIKPDEGEEPPILLHNKRVSWPFESVTKLYGFPMANEVDPTPFLATFFIVFFALCLTDAGYGLLLFLIMFVLLRFFNLPKESTGLIKLLMWGGLLTIVAGYFFGGYFGLTPSQAPSFMVEGDKFKGQILNATSGTGPLTFLILALILGIIQVLVGKIVDGWWKFKQGDYWDGILDGFLWVYFLLVILAFGLAGAGVIIPAEYTKLLKWLVLGGVAAMVLTQGRKQKGILAKFGIGVLSLYGLVGYLGDILSYSRIMALGLGTGIIAFAMNSIAILAYELIPYVGIFAAIIVVILGHIMNLALSALGAFIHSARLQFVEFFGKFMEGGGTEFKPFKRTCKYIVIQ